MPHVAVHKERGSRTWPFFVGLLRRQELSSTTPRVCGPRALSLHRHLDPSRQAVRGGDDGAALAVERDVGGSVPLGEVPQMMDGGDGLKS